MKSNIKLSNERVETAKVRLSKCLNMLEATAQELDWACEAEGWNPDVVFQIKDAATNLGFSLATLCRWNDEPDKNEV